MTKHCSTCTCGLGIGQMAIVYTNNSSKCESTRHCPYCESTMGLIATYCGNCGEASMPY